MQPPRDYQAEETAAGQLEGRYPPGSPEDLISWVLNTFGYDAAQRREAGLPDPEAADAAALYWAAWRAVRHEHAGGGTPAAEAARQLQALILEPSPEPPPERIVMTKPSLLPRRVVDRHYQGWYLTGGLESDPVYQADYWFKRDLATALYGQLAEWRGPLRPVLPAAADDEAALRALFGQAGRKTVTTIAAALETVFDKVREEQGGPFSPGSYAYAQRVMTAGREGSWESAALAGLITFGNGLNLQRSPSDHDIFGERKAGPNRRVDRAARDAMAVIFTRWVTAPGRYTEVAGTLAGLVSGWCDRAVTERGLVSEMATAAYVEALDDDERRRRLEPWALRIRAEAGWRLVADQYLMPGGVAKTDFSTCYRLLYSASVNFDPGLIPP